MVYIYFDVWFPIFLVLIVLLIILLTIRRRRLRRLRTITTVEAPVVVTSATHIPPGGYPPPQTSVPATYQTNVYAAPYQPQMGAPQPMLQTQMPMPMPMPAAQPPPPGLNPYPYAAPYPPVNPAQAASAANMNPPSYDMAMGGQASTYEKQAPYNPNFAPH